ncbi:MAG: UDP-N-acetylmuramoyl-L-alanyl-D-glutamate--2,6-diaminopimelate ligase [Deltaproteobacteria bacterium]|nr:UDP-N-acetylmuramoyl-L-alanyl-D-glutamate--2,6-diaminopimelate ligase [Deltaproteobacteria bacterium]
MSIARDAELGRLVTGARSRGLRGELRADGAIRVRGLAYDSRRVAPGDLFFALPGTRTDGSAFVDAALAAGAVAVVCSADQARADLPCFAVPEGPDVLSAAGVLASAFYGDPSESFELVGVTGTNGKTSCTYLLESVWKREGRRPGVIGTIVQRCGAFERTSAMTTPSAIDVQAVLAEMAGAGCDRVAMEVSSHALDQRRVAGCRFRAAIFTNLTRDHLDYHDTEDSYFAAKASLFRLYLQPGRGAAVLNADDLRVGQLALELPGFDVWTYSCRQRRSAAAPRASVVRAQCTLAGIRAMLDLDGTRVEVVSPLVGAANLSNIVAVAAAARALGAAPEVIGEGLSACPPVPGRMERVSVATRSGLPAGAAAPAVFVDYAHTPDALERSLRALLPETRGRLIVVFGCGGNRDRGKRPIMGRIAGQLASLVVLTSDNPRDEKPRDIIAEIEEGIGDLLPELRPAPASGSSAAELAAAAGRGYLVLPDREQALQTAIAAAGPDDVVMIAGKGHEDYQEASGVRRSFDDRVLARHYLARCLERGGPGGGAA